VFSTGSCEDVGEDEDGREDELPEEVVEPEFEESSLTDEEDGLRLQEDTSAMARKAMKVNAFFMFFSS